jgi:hypothetical protein
MPNIFSFYDSEPCQPQLVSHMSEFGIQMISLHTAKLDNNSIFYHKCDLIYIDLTRVDVGNAAFANAVIEELGDIPVIVAMLPNTPAKFPAEIHRRIVDIVYLPSSHEELTLRVKNNWRTLNQSAGLVGTGINGLLSDQNLIDLLYLFSGAKHTGLLTLINNEQTAKLAFREGKLIFAEMDTLQGLNCLDQLFIWFDGHFYSEETNNLPVENINRNTEEIITAGLEVINQYLNLVQQLPDFKAKLFGVARYDLKKIKPEQEPVFSFFVQGESIDNWVQHLSNRSLNDFAVLLSCLDDKLLFTNKEDRDRKDMENRTVGRIISRLGGLFGRRKEEDEYSQTPADKNGKNVAQSAIYQRHFANAQLMELKEQLETMDLR